MDWFRTTYIKVIQSQKVFHFGSDLQKQVANQSPEHYPSKWRMLRRVISHLFLEAKWKTLGDQATFSKQQYYTVFQSFVWWRRISALHLQRWSLLVYKEGIRPEAEQVLADHSLLHHFVSENPRLEGNVLLGLFLAKS